MHLALSRTHPCKMHPCKHLIPANRSAMETCQGQAPPNPATHLSLSGLLSCMPHSSAAWHLCQPPSSPSPDCGVGALVCDMFGTRMRIHSRRHACAGATLPLGIRIRMRMGMGKQVRTLMTPGIVVCLSVLLHIGTRLRIGLGIRAPCAWYGNSIRHGLVRGMS